ncbi:FAD-dependent thymidylate synthase [Paracidobacterium acidisoli]|uniref:Alternative thymidylate synthase n=1 Tax=Paracidobacterium acidisoli TaxID=2303751 RepID=A0A372IKS8_9BACT|nr:FAD-dependent thymidylate synthase [Paracidobacterium acidisoli]MBT9332911.1 FAD-dependent thymidylate synthase [Paracidobacterium acidisoli]
MPETQSVPAAPAAEEQPRNQTEVFAVHGADPEVLAYAMAKYSRSSLSMKDSLREISSQRAEQFLNTFYFQYGHRSIADLAHIAFAVERLSLLAAIVLVDEQRWDGQERSTRYQNFRKSGWYMPGFGTDTVSATLFRETIEHLFTSYHSVSEGVFAALKQQTAKPDEMKPEAFDRTLKARAFDVARYLLPLATNTSLGQIVNARTLETQVSRLLSSPFAEIRQLGEQLRAAAAGPAWNVHAEELASLQREIAALDPALGERAAALLTREVKTAPTLVKYAAPNDYALHTRQELAQAASGLMKQERIQAAPLVDLIEESAASGSAPLEIDIATTLLYGQCHYPYRQIRSHVEALSEPRRNEILALGTRSRGRHDELLREFSSGQALRFDILMDIGGFRDMHRHRRCVQILQSFTCDHGYAVPEGIAEAGLQPVYETAVQTAQRAYATLSQASAPEAAASAQYLLPLGTRNRALFKMDFAEALYISELRSQPQGHFSYRRVAWEMYQAVRKAHPVLAEYFRVSDVNEPVDLLKR